MAYYLRKRFGTDGIGLMLFGTFYALSAYVLARVPTARELHIDTNGEMLETELVLA